MSDKSNRRPLLVAGTMLGIGMGGFIDGILFHQILQTHNMLSAKFPTTQVADPVQLAVNLEVNMFWDGWFHVLTWTVTAVGIAMLWRALGQRDVPHSTRSLVGSMFLGWGLFNLVEGIINHHLLHLHHVVETASHLGFDLAFLASGLVFIGLGAALIRSARSEPRSPELHPAKT
jgi:uncharacterized membrane protein